MSDHATIADTPYNATAPVATAVGQSRGVADAVEAALATALEAATAAVRFDVVAQLARELEARRLARAPNVVAFGSRHRAR